MPDFFKNNADQKCPACKMILKKPIAKYPTLLCNNCMKKVTDSAYVPINFIHNGYSGVNGFYLTGQGNIDSSKPYTNTYCYIQIGGYNVPCLVDWDRSKQTQDIYIYTS